MHWLPVAVLISCNSISDNQNGVMLLPSIRAALAFAPRVAHHASTRLPYYYAPSEIAGHAVKSCSSTRNWMSSSADDAGNSGNATTEKTEEEKAAIKAAREERK